MKTILKSTQLQTAEKSYIVDLIMQNNSVAVEIIQYYVSGEAEQNSIKVSSSLLSELIKVLENYHANLPLKTTQGSEHLSELDKQKIQRYYLKGVSLKI